MKKISNYFQVIPSVFFTISLLLVSCVNSSDKEDNQNTDNNISSSIPIEFIEKPLIPEQFESMRPNESLFINKDRTFTYTRKENVNYSTVEQIEIIGKLNTDNTVTYENENKYQFKNGRYLKPTELLYRWNLDTIYGFLPVISLYKKLFNTTTWSYQESPIFFHPPTKITVGNIDDFRSKHKETRRTEEGNIQRIDIGPSGNGNPFDR